MLRTTIGLSFILMLGGLAACSSKATDDDNDSGGNGTIVAGNGNSGGTSANGAGTSGTAGGTRSMAGSTSTAGNSSGACTEADISCADATNVNACNSVTGEIETLNCIDEYATLGFISTGCSKDATGEGCDLTGVKDEGCQRGAPAYGFCAGASTDEDVLDIYVGCFQDYMGAHTFVPCFADYVSETMTTDADCQAAIDACLGAGGAGPGDTGAAGAGGAP